MANEYLSYPALNPTHQKVRELKNIKCKYLGFLGYMEQTQVLLLELACDRGTSKDTASSFRAWNASHGLWASLDSLSPFFWSMLEMTLQMLEG